MTSPTPPPADDEQTPGTDPAAGPTTGPATEPELPADIAALNYEEARDQLVDVVHRLENGTADLEDSIRLWERGEALAVRCQQWLDGARERLDKVTGA